MNEVDAPPPTRKDKNQFGQVNIEDSRKKDPRAKKMIHFSLRSFSSPFTKSKMGSKVSRVIL